MDVVKTSLLRWTNNGITDQIGRLNGNDYAVTNSANSGGDWGDWNQDQALYTMTLDYEYSDSKTRTLQIRINQENSTTLNYWPPYDN
uniref:Fibrinogen C-terminal domain-containing protein n=1 Tax=Caenorhabditis tropicalis TaxID=1561998 RepID=A0A1I7TTT7_9PELO